VGRAKNTGGSHLPIKGPAHLVCGVHHIESGPAHLVCGVHHLESGPAQQDSGPGQNTGGSHLPIKGPAHLPCGTTIEQVGRPNKHVEPIIVEPGRPTKEGGRPKMKVGPTLL
jgi:hypothetical protein